MISVIIGVFNNEKTIAKAILSVLNQTLPPKEIIVCDDASTDNSFKVLLGMQEVYENLVLLKNDKNMGLAFSLNRCLEVANGKFIARMDGDDFSYPDRFFKQIEFLNQHNELDFVGCGANFVFENKILEKVIYPIFPNSKVLIKYNPFIHPSLIFKKSALLKIGGYNDDISRFRCEDYDLLFRLYENKCYGGNLQEILFDYTENPNHKKHSFISRKNEFVVKNYGFKALKLPIINYIYVLKPLIYAFIPHFVYKKIKNIRRKNVKS